MGGSCSIRKGRRPGGVPRYVLQYMLVAISWLLLTSYDTEELESQGTGEHKALEMFKNRQEIKAGGRVPPGSRLTGSGHQPVPPLSLGTGRREMA